MELQNASEKLTQRVELFTIGQKMPYVSPRGAVNNKIPPKQQKTATKEREKSGEAIEHVPSKELGEVNSRDRDQSVVEELDEWKGWSARKEGVFDEGEVGPLDTPDEEVNGVNEKTNDGMRVQVKEVGAVAG